MHVTMWSMQNVSWTVNVALRSWSVLFIWLCLMGSWSAAQQIDTC